MCKRKIPFGTFSTHEGPHDEKQEKPQKREKTDTPSTGFT